MAQVAGRHVLFSGCARGRGGEAARQATVALIKALGIDAVYEAPDTGCCGARADRRVGDAARRRALAPVYELAAGGADVICLSPACRRVVAGYMPPAPGGHVPAAVRDVGRTLTEVYGLGRLEKAETRGLVGLRVALHASCHANHNAVVREQFLTAGLAARGIANLTRALSGSASLRQLVLERGAVIRPNKPAEHDAAAALAKVVAATGASPLGDASAAGRCAQVPLAFGLRGILSGRKRVSPCLDAAARSGADVLVTPCFLCYMALNANQRGTPRASAARSIPVLHLSQLVGVACEIAPARLELASTTVSPRRALQPFIV